MPKQKKEANSLSATSFKKLAREKDVQKLVIEYLERLGFEVFRINNVGVYDPAIKCHRKFSGKKGVSDLEVFTGNRIIKIETKRPGKKPTVEQVHYQELVNQCTKPPVAVVADDFDKFVNDLKRILNV